MMYFRKYFFIVLFIFATLVFFGGRSSFYDWMSFTSGSMLPNIKPGSFLLVNKSAYGLRIPFTAKWVTGPRPPKVGELVAFRYPRDPSIIYVKRIIASAGDSIQVQENGDVILNDKKLAKDSLVHSQRPDDQDVYFKEQNGSVSYIIAETKESGLATDKITLNQGEFFVMGDNRDRSSDSRLWGTVPIKNILGKVDYSENQIFPLFSEY